MSHKITVLLLSVLIFSSSVSADQTRVLETDMNLSNNQSWDAVISVDDGELNVSVSRTQGNLNFTLTQQGETILYLPLASNIPSRSVTLEVVAGEVNVYVHSGDHIIPSTVEITILQDKSDNSGLFIAGGTLAILLVPIAYIIGRSQATPSQ